MLATTRCGSPRPPILSHLWTTKSNPICPRRSCGPQVARWQHMVAMGKVCHHPLWITTTTNTRPPRLGPALMLPATQMSRSRGRGSSRAYAVLPSAKLQHKGDEGERVKCRLGHYQPTINRPHSQDAESAFSHQYVLTKVFCGNWDRILPQVIRTGSTAWISS